MKRVLGVVVVSAITFAVLSLLCAGCSEFIGKRYSLVRRPIGVYLAGIGFVWLVLHLCIVILPGPAIEWTLTTIEYGIWAGLILILANLCYVQSLAWLEASFASTIYRLNTIGVVILSFLFLNEDLGFLKLSGITLGVMSILILAKTPRLHEIDALTRFGRWAIYMVLAAAVFRAAYGVITKAGISAGADVQGMVVLAAFFWVPGGLLYSRIFERQMSVPLTTYGYCGIVGCIVFALVYFLMEALVRGEASIVIPIANFSFLVVLLFSVLTRMERFTVRKCKAILLAIGAIVVLAQA